MGATSSKQRAPITVVWFRSAEREYLFLSPMMRCDWLPSIFGSNRTLRSQRDFIQTQAFEKKPAMVNWWQPGQWTGPKSGSSAWLQGRSSKSSVLSRTAEKMDFHSRLLKVLKYSSIKLSWHSLRVWWQIRQQILVVDSWYYKYSGRDIQRKELS